MSTNKKIYLMYEAKDYTGKVQNNRKNFNLMVESLHSVGIELTVEEEKLTISLNEENFKKVKSRNAGAKKSLITMGEENKVVKYSDIVYMMQTLTGTQISKVIHINTSTFSRRKKLMLNSEYYKKLDKNKLADKEYLMQADGNEAF